MSKTVELARHLETLHINNMYKNDFYWTWDKTDEEIDAVFTVADALRDLRERNKNTKVFNSGLGISIFRDNSTRTRFSFASACNLLGLEEQVLDEKVSQIAHGETVRETANMVSFMADVIGIRDDMFIGEGHKYQKTFIDALEEGYRDGILEQRPTLVNLQCDVDHPTQCMADMLHIIHYFGGVENLKGKKVAMTWAYSPSYGKPLSVPQGVIGLFTRFGMDVTLAHPEGYEVMPEVEEIAKKNAAATGGSFKKCNDMKEAFRDADIVYPKSWAPFKAMEGQKYLKEELELSDELIEKLTWLGISGIANVLCCIKMAKYYELTENDVVGTVLTDSAAMYQSRIEELNEMHGAYNVEEAKLDHNLHMLGLKTDNLMELTYTDRKRIHNLKYYTWVEQQARDVKDLNALWYDTKGTWDAVHAQAAELDELINEFNEATGLLKAL